MNICPSCGVKSDVAFCPECGTRMEEEKTNSKECPKCGFKGDFSFCPECGSKMVEVASSCTKKMPLDNTDIEGKTEDRIEDEKNEHPDKDSDSMKSERKTMPGKEDNSSKINKKIIMVIAAIVAACVVFAIVFTTVIKPTTKYNEAVSLIDEGKYTEAYQALAELDGYKDSNQKMQEIWPQYNMETIQSASVGDYVTFGAYPQSSSNSMEDIEWLVLDKKDGKLLLISKYVLDARPYNNRFETKLRDVTWEACWLREWLNGDFMEKAFNSFEKSHIELSEVKAEKNTYNNTPPGNDTEDMIFIINQRDAEKYFDSNESRIGIPTEYARLEGTNESSNLEGCFWLLRTPGGKSNLVPTVWPGGGTDAGFTDDFRGGIRPSLWLNPEL